MVRVFRQTWKPVVLFTLLYGFVLASPAQSFAATKSPSGLVSRTLNVWSDQQNPDGTFPDYIKQALGPEGRNNYSESMMGAASLRWGIRFKRQAWIDSGIKAVSYAVDHPAPINTVTRLFDDLALVDAYAEVSPFLKSTGQTNLLKRWQDYLRTAQVEKNSVRPINQQLIMALVQYQTASLNFSSTDPQSILFDKHASKQEAVSNIKNLSRIMMRGDSPAGAIVGDTPDYPLSYHSLCAGVIARLVKLGAGKESRTFASLLPRVVLASYSVSGPDGQVAYSGRSNEESWALAMNAYAGRMAATQQGYRLARNSLDRLDNVHANTEWGMALTPILNQDFGLGLEELDSYVAAAPYTGLTLLGLYWAETQTQKTTKPKYSSLAVVGGATYPKTGILRTSKVWVSIRGGESYGLDPRSAPGIMGLKVLSGSNWIDLLAGRAKRPLIGQQTGPLLEEGGITPSNVIVSSSGKSLRLNGEFSTTQPMQLTVSTTSCGARFSVDAVAGQKLVLNLLIPDSAASKQGNMIVWQQGQASLVYGESISVSPGSSTANYSSTANLRAVSQLGEKLQITVAAPSC